MRPDRQSGMSLIEVLVAIIVTAVGLLGFVGIQLAAAKYNKEASLRSVATVLALEIADRMRSNIAGVKAGDYDRNMGYAVATNAVAPPTCGSISDCSASTLAQLDIANWQKELAAALPGGAGAIIPGTTMFAKSIVVMWQDKSLMESASPIDPACSSAPNSNTPVSGIRCFNTMFIP